VLVLGGGEHPEVFAQGDECCALVAEFELDAPHLSRVLARRFAPIQETPFGTVDAAGDAKRQGWLDWMRDCGSSPQHCCSGPYPRRRRSYGEATGVVARGKAALSTQRSAPNFKASPSTGALP